MKFFKCDKCEEIMDPEKILNKATIETKHKNSSSIIKLEVTFYIKPIYGDNRELHFCQNCTEDLNKQALQEVSERSQGDK